MGPPPRPNVNTHGKQTNGRQGRNLSDPEYDDYPESTKSSIVQVKDSQTDDEGTPIRFQYQISSAQHHPELIEEGSGSGSEGSGEGCEEGADEDDSQLIGGDQLEEDMSQWQGWIQQMPNKFNTGAQSYPTTTSGPPTVGKPDEEEQLSHETEAMRQANYAPQHQQLQQQQPATMPQMAMSRQNRSLDMHYQTQPQPLQGANPPYRGGKALSRQPQLGERNLPHRDPSPLFQPDAKTHGRGNSMAQSQMVQQPAQQQSAYFGTPATNQSAGYPASTVTLQPSNQPTTENAQQPQRTLDYDANILYNMNYDELRNQSLDEDPRMDKEAINRLFPPKVKDFSMRLEHAKGLDENCQKAFFDSLPLEQWEKAGDWFLEQFTNILDRMRKARVESRKIASQFEDEVHKRHDAVESKKRHIDEALENMRSNGQSVLRTPKKRRTTRDISTSSTA